MNIEITSRKLRNSNNLDGSLFLLLYSKLILDEPLSGAEYRELLKFAVIFIRQEDSTVAKLGYKIILKYSLDTADFTPLIAIADRREIMPIIGAVNNAYPQFFENQGLSHLMSVAHQINFKEGDITRTAEQIALRQFNKSNEQAVVVAPTSYGKSEMLINRAIDDLPGAVCILVPSKALISQTKASLVSELSRRNKRVRVISHAEAYNEDSSFIAVLTQERLHRLLTDHPTLKIDHLLIDEAQNVLTGDVRSIGLSQVILITRQRNPEMQVAYYTPFLESPDTLRHVNGADSDLESRTVNETVKVERYFVGEVGQQLLLFDQFLARTFETEEYLPRDPASAVLKIGGNRTLAYLNRPRDAQHLALQLADKIGKVTLSPLEEKAIEAIGDLIHPDYLLIDVIKHGVLFHHGQIPDVLRQYIENLFREDKANQKRYLVTTSTLLEGVNTPADSMILFTPVRGRGYLTRSSFRNLVGRVARFSEIFSSDSPRLSLLLPKIHVIKSAYAPKDWDPIVWLKDRADPAKRADDSVSNPLLETGPQEQSRIDALERLENIERGTSGLDTARIAITEIGKACFRHGVNDFDIFRHETLIQMRIEALENSKVTNADELIQTISKVFLEGIELIGDTKEDLTRIAEYSSVRDFYSMLLSWRANGAPQKLMISRFLKYWEEQPQDLIWVGSGWGDEKRSSTDFKKAYIRKSKTSQSSLVNLAIVRIKAELDYVDYHIMKYLEILFSLNLVDESFFLKVKYGTDNRYLITLLRNGLSFELAKLLEQSYKEFLTVDIDSNLVEISPEVVSKLTSDEVNDILIFEARGLTGSDV